MQKTINSIIEDEFDLLKIGTLHNTKRCKRVMSNMIKNPGKSVLSQGDSRSEAKATYQFLNNDDLDFSEISNIHRIRTIERIDENGTPVLLVQDTTCVNYDSQSKKEDIGYMCEQARGVKLHSTIALSPEGLNLGLLHQQEFSNDPSEDETLTDYEKRSRPIEEKQSYRWINSFKESILGIPNDIDLTVVSDREGDIYEYMDIVEFYKKYF